MSTQELACIKISPIPISSTLVLTNVDDYGVLHHCSETIASPADFLSLASPWFLEARGGIVAFCYREVPTAGTHRDVCTPGERTATGIQHPAHW